MKGRDARVKGVRDVGRGLTISEIGRPYREWIEPIKNVGHVHGAWQGRRTCLAETLSAGFCGTGLYGIKQCPRIWFLNLHSVLTTIGFRRTDCDCSVYVHHRDGIRVIASIHFDGLLLASDSGSDLQRVEFELFSHFDLRATAPSMPSSHRTYNLSRNSILVFARCPTHFPMSRPISKLTTS